MPLYEYQCKPNGHRFEVRHGINEPSPAACPECGAELRRVIHPVGIVFKGSGFYATDSRAASSATKPADGKKSTDDSSGADSSKSEASKSESPKADSSSSGDAPAAG